MPVMPPTNGALPFVKLSKPYACPPSMPNIMRKPIIINTIIVITLINESQNSVSPKALTVNILSNKSNVMNIKLQVNGLKKWNTFQ